MSYVTKYINRFTQYCSIVPSVENDILKDSLVLLLSLLDSLRKHRNKDPIFYPPPLVTRRL